MLMYGWMVFVEHAPERYDWAVRVMTFGQLDRIKDMIAQQIEPGDRVLDIGCGTGTLALRMIEAGAHVTGLDPNEYMLGQAEKRCADAGHPDKFTPVRDSVTQMHKHFGDEMFDVVTATMCLGEFPPEYLDYVMQDCRRILKPGGRLLIGDECWPKNIVVRTLYRGAMVLFWIPQFLLLRRPFFPIKDLEKIVRDGDIQVRDSHGFRGTSFRLISALRPGTAQGKSTDRSAVAS